MFLMVVDAYSKWPEVIPMKSTSSAKTIEVLRDLFARFGISNQIVSDNGPQFVSEEFLSFTKSNGIRHKLLLCPVSSSNEWVIRAVCPNS